MEGNLQKEDEHFQKVYENWKGTKTKNKDITYKVIPKFYFKVFMFSFNFQTN